MYIIYNFAEKIGLWDKHIKAYDQSVEYIVRIRRIIRDFKEQLKKMEEYFFYIQERYTYFATPKISAFLSRQNKIKLNESKDFLNKKITKIYTNAIIEFY